MREAINQNTLFITVALARGETSSLILVPEGDDDHYLLTQHINNGDMVLIMGGGRGVTLEAARLAEENGLKGVRFLVDSDYDRAVVPVSPHPPNVIFSTFHDLMMDTILADISTLDRLVSAHMRGVNRNGTTDAREIREKAFDLAASLAPIRIVNQRHSLELNFESFPFGAFSTAAPSRAELCQMVVWRTKDTVYTAEALVEKVGNDENSYELAVEHLVGDHDLFRSLARVLKEHGVFVSSETLMSGFLATVTCAHIALTDWYAAISSWGRDNSRSAFRCPCAA